MFRWARASLDAVHPQLQLCGWLVPVTEPLHSRSAPPAPLARTVPHGLCSCVLVIVTSYLVLLLIGLRSRRLCLGASNLLQNVWLKGRRFCSLIGQSALLARFLWKIRRYLFDRTVYRKWDVNGTCNIHTFFYRIHSTYFSAKIC